MNVPKADLPRSRRAFDRNLLSGLPECSAVVAGGLHFIIDAYVKLQRNGTGPRAVSDAAPADRDPLLLLFLASVLRDVHGVIQDPVIV